MMSERLGRWDFWLLFVGFNLDLLPDAHPRAQGHAAARLHLSGRRCGWGDLNLFVSLGAALLAAGFVLFFVERHSQPARGCAAGDNPWDAPHAGMGDDLAAAAATTSPASRW